MVKKELIVAALQNGTVIDHIPAENLFKVISILKLDEIPNQITFGTNLQSKRMGKKAIVKVTGKFFKDDEINKISLVAPEAKLNIIKEYVVIEKKVVSVPSEVIGIVKCFNPKCITNNEDIVTQFSLVESKICSLRCHYCEKITTADQMQII